MTEVCVQVLFQVLGGLIKNKIKKPFKKNLVSLTDVGHISSMQLLYYNVIVMHILLFALYLTVDILLGFSNR